MAIFCLANDMEDLKNRLAELLSVTLMMETCYCRRIKGQGAMASLLKDALNLI